MDDLRKGWVTKLAKEEHAKRVALQALGLRNVAGRSFEELEQMAVETAIAEYEWNEARQNLRNAVTSPGGDSSE